MRTTLYSPYNGIILPDGKTVRFAVPVGNRNDVEFYAEERESGKKIKINDEDIFVIEPQGVVGEPVLLTVPDKIGN